jgi:hypothetical protein
MEVDPVLDDRDDEIWFEGAEVDLACIGTFVVLASPVGDAVKYRKRIPVEWRPGKSHCKSSSGEKMPFIWNGKMYVKKLFIQTSNPAAKPVQHNTLDIGPKS